MRLLPLLLLVLALPAHAQNRSLIIIGSAYGPFGQHIARELRGTYGRPLHVCHSASGMSRPDYFDWDERERDIDFRGQHVVVLMGGNDAQSIRYLDDDGEWAWLNWRRQEDWMREYTTRFHRFLEYMCSHGALHVIVVMPPAVLNERLEDRLDRVRGAMAEAIGMTTCATAASTTGVDFDESSYLEDGVHLSRSGAALAWERIGPDLRLELGARDGEAEAAVP